MRESGCWEAGQSGQTCTPAPLHQRGLGGAWEDEQGAQAGVPVLAWQTAENFRAWEFLCGGGSSAHGVEGWETAREALTGAL